MEGISIKAISSRTRTVIAEMLNPIIPLSLSDEGYPRDWRGLFKLCGINQNFMQSTTENLNPTMKVLRLWTENDSEGSTIDILISYIERINRYDIVEDITPLLEEDIESYKKQEQYDSFEPEYEIFTIDDLTRYDQGLGPQMYDAFVLFSEDDINFATELIEILEKQYDLKLCTKDRDIRANGDEHEVMIKLIKERCNKLIVILSPAFMESASHRFFLRFGQGMMIEWKQAKTIPCICKRFTELPPELMGYFMLDYTRHGAYSFWERLYSSLKLPSKINRTRSQPQRRVCKQRAALPSVDDKDTLKPIAQAVKFSSMVNLTSLAEKNPAIDEQNLSPSPSINSLGSCPEKKMKSKMTWFKMFIPKNHILIKSQVNNSSALGAKNSTDTGAKQVGEKVKDKKKFWSKHTKKLAVAN